MKKNFFASICLMLFVFGFLGTNSVFWSEPPKCPDFTKIELTADEVVSKISACQAARANSTTASITEYNCPSGEFDLVTKQPITIDTLAYHIGVNLYMNEVNREMKEYMQKLHSSREKNTTAWINEYNSCIEWKPQKHEKSLTYFYENLCSFNFVNNFLNTNSDENKKFNIVTEGFPQQNCSLLAEKNKKMWSDLGAMIMNANVSKSYENDRKYFIEGVQGQYRSIIEKFHNYQKIVFRASSKITNYIQNPVK